MDHTFQVLEKALNGSTVRQNAIAHNISNINTPGFRQFLVNFEDQLASSDSPYGLLPLKLTKANHIGNEANTSAFEVERDTSPALRADGNNVNLEEQMTAMVKNDVYFNAALNQINTKIAMKKYVISGGKG
jgi:flagellar basal-body rod protein FlgB